MAVKVTPEQLAEKWANRMKGSIEDIRRGVEAVTVAPGRQAAAKADKWQARLAEASTKAKWASRVGAVTLEEWQRKYIDKGLGRIASGVDASQDKMVAFASQLIAYENRVLEQIAGLPDLTLEDSIRRATTWIREMSKLQIK